MMSLSPASWLATLEKALDDRWCNGHGARLSMAAYDAYYEGDQELYYATRKYREAFGSLFVPVVDNWMPLVVDSSVERLKVQGFRFGIAEDSTATVEKQANGADDKAWDIWQFNGMDAQSTMVHTEAVKLGEAYWLVEPGPRTSSDPPRITCEHPMQVIVAVDPADHRKRRAALKKWQEDGYAFANLYLPDFTFKYQSQAKLKATAGGSINWQQISRFDNRLGEVPVIPLCNAPSMLRGGTSDLQVAAPMQNGINMLLSNMLLGSEYLAFPQRVAIGVEIPKDANGQPIRAAELMASQSRLWAFANENAKIAEFSAADLNNYVTGLTHLRDDLTAHTKLPAHYVSGEASRASGDALKAGETGLVAKVNSKKANFGEAHEDTMRLAFKAMGDEARAEAFKAETIWQDSESRTFGELIDGLVKLSTIGVPFEVLWERAGFSPTEISRMLKTKGLPNPTGVGAEPTPAQPAPPGQMANAQPARATFSPIN